MTDAELDDLEAKAKAATPGPYHEDDGHIHSTPRSKEAHAYVMRLLNDPEFKRAETDNQINRPWHGVACVSQDSKNFDADVAYLLAANPATVLALIAEVRRLREIVCDEFHGPDCALGCGYDET